MNAILLISHAPLASALRAGALHVFADAGAAIAALDVRADASPQETLSQAQAALARLPADHGVLILSDICGATPCNIAQLLCDGTRTRLLAGVNLPMLLRALNYRHEPLDSMMHKAMTGGVQGIYEPDSAAGSRA